VENHDKPAIRGQLSGFWTRRCDQPAWADCLSNASVRPEADETYVIEPVTASEELTMLGYILMHADVTDPEEYEEYKAAVAKVIEDYGGRYLVRGGASAALEGDFHSRVVLLEFPSYGNALTFYRSHAYQAVREIRLRSTNSCILAMEGLSTL
jgi:uncharacterized protein (DUF1330 family)